MGMGMNFKTSSVMVILKLPLNCPVAISNIYENYWLKGASLKGLHARSGKLLVGGGICD